MISTLRSRIRFLIRFSTISLAIAVVIILLINYSHEPYYSSSFIVESEILDPSEAAGMIEDLRMLMHEHDTRKFCEYVNIEEEEINQIKSIDIPAIIKQEDESLEILVTTYSSDMIPKLSEGILNFLNNVKYVKNKISTEQKYLRMLVKALETEIIEIENLKKPIRQYMSGDGNTGFEILAPSYVNVHLMFLKEKRINTVQKIEELQGFKILKEAYVPNNPVAANNIMYGVVAIILTGVFATVFTLYQEHLS